MINEGFNVSEVSHLMGIDYDIFHVVISVKISCGSLLKDENFKRFGF